MKLKEIFKTAEGIAVLTGFTLIIITGAKIFAYLGLGAYTIINLPNGIEKVVSTYNYLKNKIVSIFKKEA
jgi:hypothetical protein